MRSEVPLSGGLLRHRTIKPHVRSAENDEFNTALHGLRGIAAMMVFVAHLLGGVAEHVYFDRASYVSFVEGPWNFGRWGVWLFFVISGFVILPSLLRYSPKDFAVRRFVRLYPVFLVFSLLFIALNLTSNAYPDLNRLGVILPALLMVNLLTDTEQLTPNAWSLSYEVLFYAVACALVHFSIRQPKASVTAALSLIAVLLLCLFPAMAFFLAGIGIKLLHDRKLVPPPELARALEVVALIACAVFASIEHYSFDLDDLTNPNAYAVFAATIAYVYFAACPRSYTSRVLSTRPLFYLGTVSYSLYLAHPYTYFAMRQVFQKLDLFHDAWAIPMAIFILTTLLLTLLFTHVVYRWLEKYPYSLVFHQRIYRK